MGRKRKIDIRDEAADAEKVAESDVLQSLLEASQKETGAGGVYLASEHGSHYWGIPISWVSLQWLIGGLNILPYGRLIEIAGPTGSFKSTLSIEIVRAACDAGGYGIYLDTEDKLSPDMIPAVLGKEHSSKHVYVVTQLPTIGDWQQALTSTLTRLRKVDPESRHPLVIVVDSLTARASEEEQDKFEKEGQAAARGYAVSALSITKFVRSMSPLMFRGDGKPHWSVVVLMVTHLKKSMDGRGRYTGGGVAKNFQATGRLWVSSVKSSQEDKAAQTLNLMLPTRLRDQGVEIVGLGARRTIRMESEKSSLGPGARQIEVDVYWGWDVDGNQHIWMDWETSTMRMLDRLKAHFAHTKLSIKEEGRRFTVLWNKKEIVRGANGHKAYSEIIKEPEIMETILSTLHIRRCREHTGNRSYIEVFSGD